MFSSWSSCVFLALWALLLAHGQEECDNVKEMYEDAVEAIDHAGGIDVDSIFSTRRPQLGNMCHLEGTCCSPDAESVFRQTTVQKYENKLVTQLGSLDSCQGHSIFDETEQFFRSTKVQLLQDFRTVYQIYFDDSKEVLWDDFYDYLATSVHTGDISDIDNQFMAIFFKLYLATFLDNPDAPRALENTEELRECFYGIFTEEEGGRVTRTANAFKRDYILTLRYFRALKAADQVVRAVKEMQLYEQCKNSMMRMTHCGPCAGFSELPCRSMCMNTMRGCLLDLADLAEPIQEFSEALVAMKDMALRFNVFTQVTLLTTKFLFLADDTTTNFESIATKLTDRCPSSRSAFFRRKRQTPGNARSPRINLIQPRDSMNASAYCFQHSLDLDLFRHLPETICNQPGISRDDSPPCWNGRYSGTYENELIAYTRSQQVNNPNVLVCLGKRQFEQEINLLRYLTREMNSITNRCSPDDEDCIEVVPTDVYYNLDDIDFTHVGSTLPPEVDEGSGSSGDGMNRNEEEACSLDSPATQSPVDVVAPGNNGGNIVDIMGEGSGDDEDGTSAARKGASPLGWAVLASAVLASTWAALQSLS